VLNEFGYAPIVGPAAVQSVDALARAGFATPDGVEAKDAMGGQARDGATSRRAQRRPKPPTGQTVDSRSMISADGSLAGSRGFAAATAASTGSSRFRVVRSRKLSGAFGLEPVEPHDQPSVEGSSEPSVLR
jgi:hypothetical protein